MKSLHARKKVIGALLLAGVFSVGLPCDMLPLPASSALAATASKVVEDTIAIHDARATADYWTSRCPEGDKVLLDRNEIQALNVSMRKKSPSLTDLLNYPGSVAKNELKKMILAAQQDFQDMSTPEEHYDANGQPISQKSYDVAKANCGLSSLKEKNNVRYALTTERTNLRLLPTAKNYFDDQGFRHYDDLQGTALDPAEPLLVLSESRDGAFVFVKSRNYTGWVSKGAMAFTDRTHWQRYVQPKDFLVVTANKKTVSVKGGWQVLFQMGSVIPLRQQQLRPDGTWTAVVPVEVNGTLQEAEVNIPADDTVHKGWLPCTQNNFIRQSMKFLGDVYGWGGMEDSVDCSSFVGDIYRSMGLEIPRDADQQELAMPKSLHLEGLSRAQRWEALKKAPVGALLFKPGHVMMYLGEDDRGTPLAIHSASSYFTFRGGEGKKHYIRQVLVSDLHYQNGRGVETIDGMSSIGFIGK